MAAIQQRRVQTQPRVGFGSGVIISKDGYIVTNNHVIDGADEIIVKLNDNREFKGRMIGTDPNSDWLWSRSRETISRPSPWAILMP